MEKTPLSKRPSTIPSHENLLNHLAPQTRLFRFVSIERLVDLFEDRELVLVRPQLWADPFEDFLSKTTYRMKDGDRIGFDLTNDFFGQCWTQKDECDGMWRSYCSLEQGARLETTAEKLLASIWNHADEYAQLRCFVGNMEYMTDTELRQELGTGIGLGRWLMDSQGKGCARALLIKRREFEYEHEVRALVADKSEPGPVKVIPTDPSELVDSVMLSPKMCAGMISMITAFLASKNFPRSAVSRSKLYDPWTMELEEL